MTNPRGVWKNLLSPPASPGVTIFPEPPESLKSNSIRDPSLFVYNCLNVIQLLLQFLDFRPILNKYNLKYTWIGTYISFIVDLHLLLHTLIEIIY